MRTLHRPLTTQLTAALLFFGFPIVALTYLVWDLPGLLFGGGMVSVGLALLLLFQDEPQAPPLGTEEFARLENLLEEEQGGRVAIEGLLKQREEELTLLEQRCEELEDFAEHKKGEAHHLATQVEELKGEIRRLLNLEPTPETFPPEVDQQEDLWVEGLPHSSRREVANQYDAHSLLAQCLERAHSLTGVRQLAGTSQRFEELSMGDYAIDLRQLFEAFRGETGAVIAIYSPKEERLLFASNLIRGLLGWGPERFIRDFSWLVRKGAEAWREAVGALGLGEEGHLEMAFRSASDEEIPVSCTIGRIPQGAFRGLILAVLYRP